MSNTLIVVMLAMILKHVGSVDGGVTETEALFATTCIISAGLIDMFRALSFLITGGKS